MRKLIMVGMAIVMAALASPVSAQEAEALRRELEQMRKNFEALRQEYQRSMDALAERLQRLEAQPQPIAAPARTVPGPVAQTPPAPSEPTRPSAIDLLRPRQPFTLGARGPGQLLFDIGLAGDFVLNLTQRNVDKANAGTFRERENRFFPREIELAFFGQIDPYARGEIRIEAGEESAGQETAVSLAEAHLTLLTLPFNTQLKMGQMRNRYGWSNQIHAHDLPWTDVPGVHRAFFGEEGLVEKGAELTWVPDLPFYLEFLAGVFDGDNEAAFGRGKITEPLVTGRIRGFFEFADEHALQVGVSVAHGLSAERQRHTLPGFDVRYKFKPDGWTHPLLTLGGEGIWSLRRREVTREITVAGDLEDTDGDGIPDTPAAVPVTVGQHRTFTRFGWYAYGEVQPFRRWAGGLRFDKVQLPDRGFEWAIQPYVTFWPSEFLRFRLGYKLTERSQDTGFSTDQASARHVNELFFQATFVLGAHPAHPF